MKLIEKEKDIGANIQGHYRNYHFPKKWYRINQEKEWGVTQR